MKSLSSLTFKVQLTYQRHKVSPYENGTFQGNECREVSKVAAGSKGNDAKHPLAEYKPFFVVLDENYRTVLTERSSLRTMSERSEF